MTKLELERFGTTCKGKELMPKTDSKNRLLAKHISDRLLGVSQWLRIARPVAQEDTIGIQS
jgi:hypothetical protein